MSALKCNSLFLNWILFRIFPCICIWRFIIAGFRTPVISLNTKLLSLCSYILLQLAMDHSFPSRCHVCFLCKCWAFAYGIDPTFLYVCPNFPVIACSDLRLLIGGIIHIVVVWVSLQIYLFVFRGRKTQAFCI